MSDKSSKKIAIVWEGYEAGGVDSYLAYLLDKWPANDEITIFYNRENKGIERLRSIMTNRTINFCMVKTIYKYYSGNSNLSLFLKYLTHVLSPVLYLINVFHYKNAFKNRNFDILMAQNGGYPGSYGVVSSCLGAYLAKIKTVTMVIHHAANLPRFGHKLFRLVIEKNLSSNMSSIIAISKATKKTIETNTHFFNFSPHKIKVIENGVHVPDRKKSHCKNNYRKQKIGIIGRLDPHKGHDDFLDALVLLSREELNNISVEFIGGFKDVDFERLKKLICKNGLGDVVKIRGYVDLPISDVILDLDLLAMVTKDFEGFGLTVVEALHRDIPVLATKVGIVPDLFPEHDKMAVEPMDKIAMANAIKKFIYSRDKRELISKEVREKLPRYDSKRAASRYRQYLTQI